MTQQALAFALTVIRLCVWLALLAAVFVPLERLFALRPKRVLHKAILSDLAFYFLSSLLPGLVLSMPLALFAVAAQRFMPSEVTAAVTSWPVWMRVIASLVVGEFGFYWGHRLSHEIPLLWRFHAVHHNAEHIDWLVNTRAHPVDMVFTRLCGLAPLYILGLAAPVGHNAALIPLLVLLLGTVWGFFIHANVWWRFGPLEWIVATPAFHHWHHANDGPTYINKNYSAMLPFIDRIFGTLYLPKNQMPRCYGTDQELPHDLVGQLLEPLKVWQPPAEPASAIGRPVRAAAILTSGACVDVQVKPGPKPLSPRGESRPTADKECPIVRVGP